MRRQMAVAARRYKRHGSARRAMRRSRSPRTRSPPAPSAAASRRSPAPRAVAEQDLEVPYRADAATRWWRRCSISPRSAPADYLIDLGSRRRPDRDRGGAARRPRARRRPRSGAHRRRRPPRRGSPGVEARASFRRQDLFAHADLRGERDRALSAARDQPAAAAAAADRASARRAHRQPRLRHGRLAARGRATRSTAAASSCGSCPPSPAAAGP